MCSEYVIMKVRGTLVKNVVTRRPKDTEKTNRGESDGKQIENLKYRHTANNNILNNIYHN